MLVLNNVPLQAYSTMRLGGEAAYLVEVTNKFEISEAVTWAENRNLPVTTVGEGSNVIWSDDGFPGLVIVNKIPGFEVQERDDENVYITVGAGENWDEVVKRSVELGLSGIETLSLIPGTAGATPIQNVGAYGTEIADVLVTIEAYDVTAKSLVTLRASDCDLGYRTSMFKTTKKDAYIISAITIRLSRINMEPPFYASLQTYIEAHDISNLSPSAIREAVISIRTSKLPDPKSIANNGSFFQNPIITAEVQRNILARFPDIPYWQAGDDGSYKLSAAWLVEQVGFKDFHDTVTGMGTWSKQPLVLVNEHAKSTADLLKFRDKITDAVHQKFGIKLIQEPELK